MENVYDRILRTRPNTFVVFSGSGRREAGFSPMPVSTTGSLTYPQRAIVPGRLSYVATSSSNAWVNFNGELCKDPRSGGAGSVEMVRMSNGQFNVSGGGEVMSTTPSDEGGQFLYLGETHSPTGSEMFLRTFDSTEILRFRVPHVYGLQHLVVNVDGLRVSVIVNGVVHHATIPEELEFIPVESTRISVRSGALLWGAAVRPQSVSDEYCREVSELLHSFPKPEEAEFPFRPVTFVYNPSEINDALTFNLEDLSYPDSPEESLMYNGSTMEDIDADYTEGWLNIPNPEDYTNVLIERTLVKPVVLGSEFEEPTELEVDLSEEEGESLPIQTPIDGYEEYSIIPDDQDDIVRIYSLNQGVIGSPEKVLVFHPDPIGNDEIGRSASIRFIPDEASLDSTSEPNRKVGLDKSGFFVGVPSLFRGGYVGPSVVMPVSPPAVGPSPEDEEPEEVEGDAPEESEVPQAYGMWVYISGSSSAVLATNGTFVLTKSASNNLTWGGISQVVLDGASYSSGVVSQGWHHIVFIPTVKVNSAVLVTPSGNTIVVYAFSIFHEESPESYINKVYHSHVNPPAIRPSTPDTLGIHEAGADIYTHDWSISSAD